ncbi:MAG: AMP phosphorylase [Candidatus Diapherotrites archaeon]|nr:AMP phosphorylase [Candidatus Diapherotrites archaeon]
MNGEKNGMAYDSFKVKTFDLKTGKFICILNQDDSRRIGITSLDRVELINPKSKKKIVAIVDLTDSMVAKNEIGIYDEVKEKIKIKQGQVIEVRPVKKPECLKLIKRKLKGEKLSKEEINLIVQSISENKISEIETAAFVSAVYIHGLDLDETTFMTKALIKSGNKLKVKGTVVDKHSIGGLNGRATMIVVPIIACTGLKIPKTSSRAITSASGTADSMDVLANVSLNIKKIRDITNKTGGVIAWGGAVDLAPADDKIIKIEHPLSLDPEGQVIASVMAKKASVGAKFVVIDLPVGKETKVKSMEKAESMAVKFIEVGKRLGIKVEVVITNGEEPSGPAFGPALEAKHVMKILEGKIYDNLAQKSVELSGAILEVAGKAKPGKGNETALEILESGKALKKMKEIIKAQGAKITDSNKIPDAKFNEKIKSTKAGEIIDLDVYSLAHVARIAGAPGDAEAGLLLHVDEGRKVKKNDVLFEIHSNNKRKLDAAVEYVNKNQVFEMEKVILKKMS